MSIETRIYRGICHEYQFQTNGSQLQVQASKYTNPVQKTLSILQTTLPNPCKLSFSSLKEQVFWLLDNGFTVSHKNQKVLFHPSLKGGMVQEEELPTIPEQELQIGQQIAEGSFGVVYLGEYQGNPVAIKKLKTTFADDPEVIEELKQESKIMSKANHLNIVRFFGLFVGKDVGFVMEYVEKGSLYQMIKSGAFTQLPVAQRLPLALQTLYGLRHLHDLQIIHRDLKSLNILISSNNKAKIADFGLSRTKMTSSLLQTSVGTPAWMAPEVLQSESYSYPADVYSMGMIIWELVELRIPFGGQNPMQVMMQLLKTGKKEETIHANTDRAIADIMRACWQTDATKRPTVLQLTNKLGEYLSEQEVIANFTKLEVQPKKAAPQPKASPIEKKAPLSQLSRATNPVPKQPSVKKVAPVPKKVASVAVLEMAFGKAKWEEYIGTVGAEPPLPGNIHEILQSQCPIWPGKKVAQTHILTLVPKTVNGKALTLQTLGELVKHPKRGNATKYRTFSPSVHENTPVGESHWVLMARDVIPNSRNKSYSDQKRLAQTYNKNGVEYEVPRLLDATVNIFMEYVRTKTRLFSDSPSTYTRCQETYKNEGKYQMVVGGFSASGLCVNGYGSSGDEDFGIALSRKFS